MSIMTPSFPRETELESKNCMRTQLHSIRSFIHKLDKKNKLHIDSLYRLESYITFHFFFRDTSED